MRGSMRVAWLAWVWTLWRLRGRPWPMRTVLELGARPIFERQWWQEPERPPKAPTLQVQVQAQAWGLLQQEPGARVWSLAVALAVVLLPLQGADVGGVVTPSASGTGKAPTGLVADAAWAAAVACATVTAGSSASGFTSDGDSAR